MGVSATKEVLKGTDACLFSLLLDTITLWMSRTFQHMQLGVHVTLYENHPAVRLKNMAERY